MKKIFTTVFALTASMLSFIHAQIHPTNGLVEYFSFDNTLTGSEGSMLMADVPNFSEGYLEDDNGAHLCDSDDNILKSNAVITGFPTGNSDFTVCFWLKLNENTTSSLFNYSGYSAEIISQNLYTTALAYSNNKLILAKAEEGVFTEMEYNYNFNTEWHHIALLHIESGNSNFLYVDGAFAGSTTLELATPDYSNARLKISESPGGIRFGNFSIDDFLVYNRVLSSSELVNLASVSVGVDENTNSLMELYPNPAYDFVTIQNLEVGSTIVVLDVTGQSVFTSTVVNSSETLDLSTWIRGMYFVQVQQNGVLIGTKKLQVH